MLFRVSGVASISARAGTVGNRDSLARQAAHAAGRRTGEHEMDTEPSIGRASRRATGARRERSTIASVAAASLIALAASGGCSVGPDYVKPETTLNQDWAEKADQ